MALQITTAKGRLADRTEAVLAVGLYAGDDGAVPGPGAAELASRLGLDLATHLAREKAKGEPGEVVAIPCLGRLGDVETVLFVGLGNPEEITPATLRKAGGVVVRRSAKTASVATSLTAGTGPDGVAAFAEGALLASYGFRSYRSDPKPAPLEQLVLVDAKATDRALARAAVRAQAVHTARDLANTPSLDKSPDWLAKSVLKLAKKSSVEVRVFDEKEMAARGFGGVLAVGQGSSRPPRFLQLTYAPARARTHVVLVGKGITFDSGGLSLKPNEGMAAMKTDMAAGAAVLATLLALPSLGLRLRVTGLVPVAENLPSGNAMRPGDVIRHYGGRTVEVLNTDAEGRLVLADALAYADAELEPDYLIDLATLTGAIGIALGKKTAGLFSTDDGLAKSLLDAAESAGERLWRMPLVEEYRADLDSDVADLRNIGGPNSGGAIVAGLFLREFVGDRRWAHLDIASAARSDSEDEETTKGATGFGVRTLLTWLEGLA